MEVKSNNDIMCGIEEKTAILIGTNSEDYYDSVKFSNLAIDEFNKRCLLIDPNFELVDQEYFTNYKNSVMVDVVVDLGIENSIIPNGRTVKIGYVHKKYKDYIIRTENIMLGIEEIDYDLERYKLDEINKICKNSEYYLNTKITKINALLDKALYNELFYYGLKRY